MDRKALAYSAVLLLSLVIVSVLVNRSMVRAVLDPADITLTLAPFATSTTSTLDQVREFKGELDFPDEDATVSLLEFIITLSTATTTHFYLPLPTTSSTTTIEAPFNGQTPFSTGTLVVTVQLVNVFPTSSTTTGSTLPGSTLPGSGQAYKGIGAGAKIIYGIKWTSPNNDALLGDHQAVLRAHVVAPGGAGSIHTTAPVTFTLLPVSIQTVFIPLQQGFNLITLPVDPGPINSRQIMDEINTQGGVPCSNAIPVFRCVIQAVEWNAGTQAFVFNTVASESGKFDVFPGKGFFVNVPTVPPSGGWDVTGTPIPAPVDLDLRAGLQPGWHTSSHAGRGL